jgi:outer membrane lipopolysaccharide assembly protein LptE/RlpB
MSIKANIRLMLLAGVICVLAGCGYRLTNSLPNQMAAGQTVWVPFIGNESVSPTAQTVLRRALYDESHALRGLIPAESEAVADLVIKGRLSSYTNRSISFSSLDRALGFNLLLDVELAIYKRGETLPFWKGLIRGSKDYPGNSDLALQRNAEEQALDAAARIVAQRFISATEQSY